MAFDQRYRYRVLQTIQMKLLLLCVWAEPAVLSSTKTALKLKYEIIGNWIYGAGYKNDLNHDLAFYCTHNCVCHSINSMFRVLGNQSLQKYEKLCKYADQTLICSVQLSVHLRVDSRLFKPYF